MKRLLLSLALTASIIVPGARAVSAFQQRPSPVKVVVVRPGETLWAIAARETSGSDVRRAVYEIRRLNALSGPLMPGQKLAIPSR